MVTGLGIAEPVGRQAGQTGPPAGTEKCRCGPASPQRAQSVSAGSQPATDIARSRKASSTSPAGWVRSASARSAPTTSRNSRSDGSFSSDGQPVGGLEHGGAGGVGGVVVDDVVAVGRGSTPPG